MQLKPSLLLLSIACIALLFSACPKKSVTGSSSGTPPVITGSKDAVVTGGHSEPKLVGEWTAKDGSKLKISAKTFTEADSPDPEDYFVKGDTIYTSFQGNLPYTKYAIKKLNGHSLDLFTPDSVVVSYTK